MAELVKDAEVRFVVPDAALMEMSKSNQWEATLRGSLKLLAMVPARAFVAMGNGECMRAELEQGRPLSLDDLISPDATIWLRGLLVEVAEGRYGRQFEAMAAEVGNANDKAREQHLNHPDNLNSLRLLIPTLRATYSEEFQKRLRANLVGQDEYVAVVSHAATAVVTDQSMSLRSGSMALFAKDRSYVMRWIWLRVETVTAWLASGGSETVAAERVTNSDIDRHYLAVGSYCDELLTNDHAMQRIDSNLRAALALKFAWNCER